MPSINQVYREWERKGLSVLLVDIREDRATVARAVAERGYVAPVVLDLNGGVSDAYGVPDYVGLTNVFRDYNLSDGDDPEGVLDFVAVSSEFYRELEAYYREDAQRWLAERRRPK